MRSGKALFIWFTAAALPFAAGCSKATPPAGTALPSSANATNLGSTQRQTPEAAIRTAILAHLAHKGTLNVQAFETDIRQLAIDGDRAQAEVEFRVKDGPGSMQLTYALAKRDNAWEVVESIPVGSNFSHPSLDQAQTPTSGPPASSSPQVSDLMESFRRTRSAQPAPSR